MAWVEVGVWTATLGLSPIAVVHKLVIGLVFLLPGLAYALMARRDGCPLGVALVGAGGAGRDPRWLVARRATPNWSSGAW